MDTLYIGDIPTDYCYAEFIEDGRINLYNKQKSTNDGVADTFHYYTIYPTDAGFFYSQDDVVIELPTDFQQISVSDKWYYRKDSITILSFTLCIAVATIWIVNIFTSVFKKGGLLSGLL